MDYNRDLEPEQEIKTMETNFVGRKTWKDYSGSKKMRNARGHQSKNEQQWEKVNRNIYIFPLKKNVYLGSFWKLSSCKTMAKKWTKKCAYMCKVVVFFLLIRPNVVVFYFLLFFTVSLAYHDFSGALRCPAEHHRKENMVTCALKKFWWWLAAM